MILLLIIQLGTSQECTPISCPSSPTDECLYTLNNEIWVSLCAADYYCNTTSISGTSYCMPMNFTLRYPGDLCSLDLQCMGGVCSSGTCTGPSLGDLCEESSGCLPGFYCLESKCIGQAKPGATCTNDYQCVNSAFCNLGTCTTYWSLTAGQLTEVPVNGLSMGCKTGAALSTGTSYICGTADVSKNLPSKCSQTGQCTSASGIFSSDCICGNNPNGQAYCPLFPGDPQVQSALTSSAKVLQNNYICNTFSRFSLNCFAKNTTVISDFLDFALNFTLIYNQIYPKIQDTQDCVNNVLNAEYFQLVNASKSINSETCPISICTNYTSYWEPNQCVLVRNDLYNGVVGTIQFTHTCPLNMMCNATNEFPANATCIEIPAEKGYPGDFCNTSAQCYSNLCQENFCLGIREREKCVNPYDCMPGFFCNQNTFLCQSLRARYESCQNTYECNTYLLCNFNICINYYSVQDKETTSIYQNGYSEACASGFAVPSAFGFICSSPPISANANTCKNIGDICYDSTGFFAKTCACGLGSSNALYCPSFEGDLYLQNAIQYQNSLMMWNQMCNTLSRFSESCFLRNSQYLGIYYYYITNLTMYLNYPQLSNSQSCLEQTFLYSDYQDSENLLKWEKNQNNNPGDNDDSYAEFRKVFIRLIILANFY